MKVFYLQNDEKCARLFPKYVRLTGHKPNYGFEYTNLVRYFVILFGGFVHWHIGYSYIEKLIEGHSFLVNGTHDKVQLLTQDIFELQSGHQITTVDFLSLKILNYKKIPIVEIFVGHRTVTVRIVEEVGDL